MTIYIECKPDFTLMNGILGVSKKDVSHEKGKPGVCRRLEGQRNVWGLIDEDPLAGQPPYLKKVKVTENLAKFGLKLLHDESNNNSLVVLCPKLEDWILKAAEEQGIEVEKYGFPDNPSGFHRLINQDLDNFGRLVAALKNSDRLKTLKRLLERDK